MADPETIRALQAETGADWVEVAWRFMPYYLHPACSAYLRVRGYTFGGTGNTEAEAIEKAKASLARVKAQMGPRWAETMDMMEEDR